MAIPDDVVWAPIAERGPRDESLSEVVRRRRSGGWVERSLRVAFVLAAALGWLVILWSPRPHEITDERGRGTRFEFGWPFLAVSRVSRPAATRATSHPDDFPRARELAFCVNYLVALWFIASSPALFTLGVVRSGRPSLRDLFVLTIGAAIAFSAVPRPGGWMMLASPFHAWFMIPAALTFFSAPAAVFLLVEKLSARQPTEAVAE